jgi:DNA polymerase-1
MNAQSENKLYVLDGNGFIYRAFYANPHLRTSAGAPTGAIYGFTAMLRRLIQRERPTHLAVAFDTGRDGWRRDLYPAYKQNRSERPEDLVVQQPAIREIVDAYRIPVLQQPRAEADDLIATLTRHAQDAGIPVVIVSSDKDLMQLVGSNVTMLDTMKDKRFGPSEVEEKFGVPPDKVLDILALAGDTSDNIPGVPGIGPKTATKLINEYSSLDELLDRVGELPRSKQRENLETYADQARLSRQLASLDDQCDIEFNLDALAISDPDYPTLKTLFERHEFWRFLETLEVQMRRQPPAPKTVETRGTTTQTILDRDALRRLVEDCERARQYGLSLHATDADPHRAHIVGIGLSPKDHFGAYIPVGHRYLGAPRQLPLAEVLEILAPLLGGGRAAAIGHNLKRALVLLARHNVTIADIACDTMLAAYVLDPSAADFSFETVCKDVLSYDSLSMTSLTGSGRRTTPADEVSVEGAAAIIAQQADLCRIVSRTMRPALADGSLRALHDQLEVPLSRVLADIEHTGTLIDRTVLASLSARWDQEIQRLQEQCHQLAGRPFNLGSPKQVGVVLFDELGMSPTKKTKTGRSTDHTVLEQLAKDHELPRALLEWRSYTKLKSTYVDTLPALAHPDGRVRTNFNQVGASTGRLSSQNPNLQNIPIRTVRGQQIRRAFIPRPGWALMCADYSQVELRVLAHLSEDPELVRAFSLGEDIHRTTASRIFDVPPLLVTPEQRGVGKTINFGVTYGMGAARLSRDLGITRNAAKAYIDAYFEKYSGVKTYFEELVNSARRNGYAETMLGRRRPIPQLTAFQRNLRALGERLAVNTPIQGSAADIIKRAMIALHRRLRDTGSEARMLMTVHDELVLETPKGELDEVRAIVVYEMENAVSLRVPLVVDTGAGANWLDAK